VINMQVRGDLGAIVLIGTCGKNLAASGSWV
jgi:hypothetical protein